MKQVTQQSASPAQFLVNWINAQQDKKLVV
jgi:hypothetical protein